MRLAQSQHSVHHFILFCCCFYLGIVLKIHSLCRTRGDGKNRPERLRRKGKSERKTNWRGYKNESYGPPKSDHSGHTSFVPVKNGASSRSQRCVSSSQLSRRRQCLWDVDDKLLFRIIFKTEELTFESQSVKRENQLSVTSPISYLFEFLKRRVQFILCFLQLSHRTQDIPWRLFHLTCVQAWKVQFYIMRAQACSFLAILYFHM